MKNKIDNDKIRAMLDRWYSGLTTPDEERLIANMLASSTDLPPDLEADRQLFSELSSVSEALPEMPDTYSSRINDALEKEMVSARKGAVATAFSRFRRGWIGRIAIGVAVFFACAFFAIKMADTPQMDVARDSMALNEGVAKKMNISDDTLQNHYLALQSSHLEAAKVKSVESAYNSVAKTEMAKDRRSKVTGVDKSVNYSSQIADSEDEYESDDSYYPHSEEANFIRENYRVVRNQDEADAILNSIFSRLESNVAMETSKLSKIDLEYDSEMSRLSGIENVGLLKEYIYEETPL